MSSTEAAAVLAVLCQHCERHQVSAMPLVSPDELSITADGDLSITYSRRTRPAPPTTVLSRLLVALLPLVDAPDPALTMLAPAHDAGDGDLPAFSGPAELRQWLQQAFSIRDSRAVLRPVAERMSQAPDLLSVDLPSSPPLAAEAKRSPAPRAASGDGRTLRRLALAAALFLAGLTGLTLVERWQTETESPRPIEQRASARDRQLAPARRTPPPIPPPAPVEVPARKADREGQGRESAASRAAATPPADPPRLDARAVPVNTPGLTGPVYSPSFDGQGSAMFFHVGLTQAQLVEARLGDRHQLVQIKALTADRARNYHVRLSPDGREVAFDSDRDGERGVYIARRDGSGIRRVSGDGFAAIPTWSPDGSRLAFVRGEPERPKVWNLWILDVATGTMHRVTSHRYGQLWGASWFPEGRRVAYSHEDALYVQDLTSGRRTRYQSPVAGRLVRTPAVSPEGGRIVFQVQGDGVWLLTLDRGTMGRILPDPSAEEFTWDPRGARVAYHSRRDGQWRIWITTAPAAETTDGA